MIEVDRDGAVRVLRLAHGKANALDLELCGALADALADFASSDDRALVLSARGAIFSAGGPRARSRRGTGSTNQLTPPVGGLS